MLDPRFRIYDVAFPDEIRKAVRKRREHPTGEPHKCEYEERGNELLQVYPWKKLLLGDFFLAKIGDRSPKALKMTFIKAAQRNDFEIAIKRTVDLDKDDCFQVTLTMFDISNWKKKAARQHGVELPIHDRSHAKAKRRHSEKTRTKRSHKKRKAGDPVFYPRPSDEVILAMAEQIKGKVDQ